MFAHGLRIAALVVAAGWGPPALDAAEVEHLPVAAVTIYPGQAVTDAMLVDREFPAGTAAQYPVVAGRDALVGKVARRTLLAGKLIASNAISEPDLVQHGTILRAVYQTKELIIATSVLALQSGALGQTIQARNIDTGKVIAGVIQADGSLSVATP
jgi:flagella basal body P-ring formation protein FlgA